MNWKLLKKKFKFQKKKKIDMFKFMKQYKNNE